MLKVPTSALFREGDDWAVYVVDGDRARKTIVESDTRPARKPRSRPGCPKAPAWSTIRAIR